MSKQHTTRCSGLLSRVALACAMLAAGPAVADVSHVVISDVTTRAFSVIWVSDEPVSGATVRIFEDADGLVEIQGLDVTLVSDEFAPALAQGIVKVDVVGLAADTTVYVETSTSGASGTVVFPDAGPLIEVRTQTRTTKANAVNEPIVNDLLWLELMAPDGVSPADGGLALVNAPGISRYPVSMFAGQGAPSPATIADLNNLFEASSATSAEIAAGDVLEIVEYRGLRCANLDGHVLRRMRRAPAHEESPPITELEQPAACFSPGGLSADADCDGRIGLVDFTRFLGKFGFQAPDCRYHADFDFSEDGRIGMPDFTQLLSVFGAQDSPAQP